MGKIQVEANDGIKKCGCFNKQPHFQFVWYRFYTFLMISIPFKMACSFIGINLW